MNKFSTLLYREWLQHRTGWALLVLIPIGLALLLTAFGDIQIDGDSLDRAGDALPAMLAMASLVGTSAAIFAIAWITALIITAGIARRDHADRSIEFWLSVPAGHGLSLATPLLMHLLIVPAAALFIGLVGGWAISLVLVTRMAGFAAWLALPWADLATASLLLTARLLAGLPLATLWLSPLILLIVLMSAWFRRWGWVLLAVGLGLGGQLLQRVFGQPLVSQVTSGWLTNAATAMFQGSRPAVVADGTVDVQAAMAAVPAWMLSDFRLALGDLGSPLLAGGLLLAAACFALLVDWRRRGAGAAG